MSHSPRLLVRVRIVAALFERALVDAGNGFVRSEAVALERARAAVQVLECSEDPVADLVETLGRAALPLYGGMRLLELEHLAASILLALSNAQRSVARLEQLGGVEGERGDEGEDASAAGHLAQGRMDQRGDVRGVGHAATVRLGIGGVEW